MSGGPTDPFIVQEAFLEAGRRAQAATKVDLKKLCFKEQWAFVTDDSPFVAGLCSRRAGKSEGICLKMLDTALKVPDCRIPYVTITRPMARNVIWGKLRRWCAKPTKDNPGGMDIDAHFNNQTLEVTLPNGSVIFLASAENQEEVEKLRGGAYPLAILDECQAFKQNLLQTLVEDILPYALGEMGGTLVCIGTPSPACAGYFYELTTGRKPGWSVHHWTMFQNTRFPIDRRTGKPFDPFDFKKRMLALWRVTEKAARVRREMYGEWVRDLSASVYRVRPESYVGELPDAPDWEHVIGADYGLKDATAFSVIAFSIALGKAVVIRAFEKTGLLSSDAADIVKELYDQYQPVGLVGDAGGLGAPYVEEVVRRYQLPMVAAEKSRKLGAIELMNDALDTGALSLLESCTDLYQQMADLEWDYSKVVRKHGLEHAGSVVRADLVISDRKPDHMCDATLYAWRECVQWLHEKPATDGPNESPGDALTVEETAMWAAALRADEGRSETEQDVIPDMEPLPAWEQLESYDDRL